jgi:hypothetical protein
MTPITVTREQLLRSTNTRGMRSPLDPATNLPDPWMGGEWKPRYILEMEMIASRSLLTLAAKYRASYLRDFFELGKKNVTVKPAENEPIGYLIPAGQARDEAVAKLVGALIEQGVEVFRLDNELHAVYGPQQLQRTNSAAEKLGSYRVLISATTQPHEVPAGSYIIFVAQPQRPNVLSLFEPQIYPNRITAQGEAERPYDVAGWTLPAQMGVDAPAVMSITEPVETRKLTLLRDVSEVRKDLALPAKIANPIKQPVKIAIYKPWMSNMDEGWTRYIFDTFNIPFTPVLDAGMREAGSLSKFDVVILPSQRDRDIVEGNAAENYPAEYAGGITQNGVTNLKNFVEGGGTLVCFDNSCDLAIKQFNLPLRNVLEALRSSEFYCPGSILSLDVDVTQSLARGLSRNTPAYFINSSAFEATDTKVRVVARYAKDNLLVSGWLLGEDKLRGKIALAEVPLGKGRVVLFGFRPQHRGQAWATLPFIWNALTPR